LAEIVSLPGRFTADATWVVRRAIRNARRRSRLSPRGFAAELGVSPDLVALWEEGLAVPPGDLLVEALRLGGGAQGAPRQPAAR
jgi:DNA-binding transcriptional regulator YiaG